MSFYKGYINAYWNHKGIGFIRREAGKDVFFSIDDIEDVNSLSSLSNKCIVEFEIMKTRKGPRAINLRICED
ncbi:cold shock domain-containing protein [Shewanella aquimarina]|uniref:cold shock domain-containing protein n=1 Tax=Shewanella aquimarina TaxID=260365 RepID=UPI002014E9B0|nr:cold shock domain-containing protein [Shewanella aquimarina]MCL2910694.1 cold shock domain-containing protein [Shewanella aquimarina]